MKFYIEKLYCISSGITSLFKSMLAKVTYLLYSIFNIKNDKKLSLYTTIVELYL